MTISQRDIKLLWGRAASRCAFPDCRLQLTQGSAITSSCISIGEQAHIIAKESSGPRGNSLLTPDERDSYANLILLCPTHHTIIDKNLEDYPVEKLHAFKTEHELWVQQTLSETWDLNQQARDLIYTDLIDAAVKYCHLYQWEEWTVGPLSTMPRWSYQLPKDLLEFRKKVFKADFPGTLRELERAIETLSILLYKAVTTFQEHSELREDDNGNQFYKGIPFYKVRDYDQEQNNKLVRKFYEWEKECHQLLIDSTKAANWLREVVRRDINPLFFAVEGKFVLTFLLTTYTQEEKDRLLRAYTQEEKDNLPNSLLAE